MRKQQDGVSIMGLLIALVLVIVLALFGMKVIPSVMEYRTAKGAIQGRKEIPLFTGVGLYLDFAANSRD